MAFSSAVLAINMLPWACPLIEISKALRKLGDCETMLELEEVQFVPATAFGIIVEAIEVVDVDQEDACISEDQAGLESIERESIESVSLLQEG